MRSETGLLAVLYMHPFYLSVRPGPDLGTGPLGVTAVDHEFRSCGRRRLGSGPQWRTPLCSGSSIAPQLLKHLTVVRSANHLRND